MEHDNAGGFIYRLPEPAKAHSVLRIPGSHTLYAGPPACMRRHALNAAEHGMSREVSFLSVTETDIALGKFEALIRNAVGQLAERLAPSPRIFYIAVFCIDDLIGTDEAALISSLTSAFPAFQFAVHRIDPISLSRTKAMSAGMQSGLYSFIKPTGLHDNGINFLGTFVTLEPECEILELLRRWGCAPVRELFRCKSYEEYQDMGKSRASVVMRFIAEDAARQMKDRLGIPFCVMEPSYNAFEVAEGYKRLAELLEQEEPDFSEELSAAKKDVEATVKALSDIPMAIDAKASLMPFSTAKALLDYGFDLRYIFRSAASYEPCPEKNAAEYIAEHYPNVQVFRLGNAKTLQVSSVPQNLIAIGNECAKYLNARYCADMWHDEGYFGFHGIHRLMALLRKAAEKEETYGNT